MKTILALSSLLLAAALLAAGPAAAQPAPLPPAQSYKSPFADPGWEAPANTLGGKSDADIWRQVRRGTQGNVSIPDKRAGVMIQDQGSVWRAWRNGPISTYGVRALAGMVGLLALFYLVRGRIRIDAGRSGRRILRFRLIERIGHWLTAGSFIVLGLTGLNVLYGKHWLMPMIGQETFAAITNVGKIVHNWTAWAFMLGLAMIFVMWVRNNLWDRYDWNWIRHGGGLFSKHSHPPAGKFNFGQKLIFWAVILGGVAVSASGLNLLFPFTFGPYGDLPGLQLAQLAHASTALALTVVILAHIYIGSIGMEGAFDAMGSGMVDENWAREHHSAWVDEQFGAPPPAPTPPAPTGHAPGTAPAE